MTDAMNLPAMPYQAIDFANRMENISRQVDAGKQSEDNNDDSGMKKACAEMESLFIFYLLKEMRATIPKDGLISGGRGEEIYTSMLDSQLAKELAAERGIGLSPLLLESMGKKESSAHGPDEKIDKKT